MARPLIALDADGVLLDFHLGYAGAWARAFGSAPGRARPARLLADRPLAGRAARRAERRPFPAPLRRAVLVVGAGDRRRARRLPPSPRRRLRPGLRLGARCRARGGAPAQPARPRLSDRAGHRHRQRGRASAAPRPTRSPPSARQAFVDDYLPYLRGVPGHVHTALVLRAPNGSPNEGAELSLAKLGSRRLARVRRFLAQALTGPLRRASSAP